MHNGLSYLYKLSLELNVDQINNWYHVKYGLQQNRVYHLWLLNTIYLQTERCHLGAVAWCDMALNDQWSEITIYSLAVHKGIHAYIPMFSTVAS